LAVQRERRVRKPVLPAWLLFFAYLRLAFPDPIDTILGEMHICPLGGVVEAMVWMNRSGLAMSRLQRWGFLALGGTMMLLGWHGSAPGEASASRREIKTLVTWERRFLNAKAQHEFQGMPMYMDELATQGQRKEVREIQDRYLAKIQWLQQQIAELELKRKDEIAAVFTAEQHARAFGISKEIIRERVAYAEAHPQRPYGTKTAREWEQILAELGATATD